MLSPYGPIVIIYAVLVVLITIAPVIVIVQLGIIASRLREIVRRLPPPPRP
jgi:hypothetical protein